MKFSKTSQQAGGSGFFFDNDAAAPADSINVTKSDVDLAINLPKGSTYSFDANSKLVVIPPVAPTAAQLLANAQTDKLSVLSTACAAQIYAGFASSALGAPYTYPAKDKDQSNLIASVTASLVPNLPAGWTTPFWCADGAGVWALRPHTAAQIQKVGLDAKAAIEAAIQKNATLAAQVMAVKVTDANAITTVQAIVW